MSLLPGSQWEGKGQRTDQRVKEQSKGLQNSQRVKENPKISKNSLKGQRTDQRVKYKPKGSKKRPYRVKEYPPEDRRTGLSHIQSPVDASLMSAAPIINLFPVNHMLDSDQSS